jgi:hypothetical protein
MGKEIFALAQRQKSFHGKTLKSSPRKETEIWVCDVNVSRSESSFSVIRKAEEETIFDRTALTNTVAKRAPAAALEMMSFIRPW